MDKVEAISYLYQFGFPNSMVSKPLELYYLRLVDKFIKGTRYNPIDISIKDDRFIGLKYRLSNTGKELCVEVISEDTCILYSKGVGDFKYTICDVKEAYSWLDYMFSLSRSYTYRKLPVVIEAFQYTKDIQDKLDKSLVLSGYVPKWFVDSVVSKVSVFDYSTRDLCIRTLEGEMVVNLDDYIIKGVKGELYPCKPDIFEATYSREV